MRNSQFGGISPLQTALFRVQLGCGQNALSEREMINWELSRSWIGPRLEPRLPWKAPVPGTADLGISCWAVSLLVGCLTGTHKEPYLNHRAPRACPKSNPVILNLSYKGGWGAPSMRCWDWDLWQTGILRLSHFHQPSLSIH